MKDYKEKKYDKKSAGRGSSAWPFASMSIISSLTAIYLFTVYGTVHWIHGKYILERLTKGNGTITTDYISNELSHVQWQLEFYRIYGLLALIFSILALFRKPKWLAWVYLPLLTVAGFVSIAII